MWYILENYNDDAFVKNLVDSTEMYFIPCVNPDGYIYNQKTNPDGGGLWRKNRRNNGDGYFGVDLNRNYGYKWGYDNNGSSPYSFDDTYRGPSAFSEPETQMVRDFCVAHHFFFSINHHTYANALIYPYAYKSNKLTPDSLLFLKYAQRLSKCNGFATGTVHQTLGYVANGDSDDWMYGDQQTKSKIFALTAETGSSFDGFWPRKSRIIPLAEANVQMNLTAARYTKESAYPNILIASIAGNAGKNALPGYLKAFPNPCNAYTYIDYHFKSEGARLQLQIFNDAGLLMRSVQVSAGRTRVLINTGDLKAGIYFYHISDGKTKSPVAKLVIVK
jgi:hypothetical protein